MISAVLFDLDETLLDRTGSLVAFLKAQHKCFTKQLGEAPYGTWCERFLSLDNKGTVHKSIVYPTILSEFGGDPAASDELLADYRENFHRYARPIPDAITTIDSLRDRSIRLGIVTNGETEFQLSQLDALELGPRFDTVLVSQSEGLRKPATELFYRAADRLGIEPPCCLFVGDHPAHDILGAQSAGMQTAWFRSGRQWPDQLPPMPGVAIDALPEILGLIDFA